MPIKSFVDNRANHICEKSIQILGPDLLLLKLLNIRARFVGEKGIFPPLLRCFPPTAIAKSIPEGSMISWSLLINYIY
jgi:hypothetical protein